MEGEGGAGGGGGVGGGCEWVVVGDIGGGGGGAWRRGGGGGGGGEQCRFQLARVAQHLMERGPNGPNAPGPLWNRGALRTICCMVRRWVAIGTRSSVGH